MAAPVAAGEAILTPAWLEPENGFSPRGVELRAAPEGAGSSLSGVKRHVAFASSADRLVVLARTGDGAEDVDLFLVDPTAPGVALRQQFTISSDTQYEVTLSGVGWGRPTGSGRRDRLGDLERVLEPGLVLRPPRPSAEPYALEITPVRQGPPPVRQAAGRVPGVGPLPGRRRHQPRRGRAAGPRGGLGRREGRPLTSLAPMAKLFACSTFRDITAMAQQIFGGIGFTLDFDIQLYFRRAKQLQLSWWEPRVLEELIAAQVLDH